MIPWFLILVKVIFQLIRALGIQIRSERKVIQSALVYTREGDRLQYS
jgi:hypothetical protein